MVCKYVERILGISGLHLSLQIIMSILVYSKYLRGELFVTNGNRKQKVKLNLIRRIRVLYYKHRKRNEKENKETKYNNRQILSMDIKESKRGWNIISGHRKHKT